MKLTGIIFLIFTFFIRPGADHSPVSEDEKMVFEEVVQVESLPKAALFINAMNYGKKVTKASERKTKMYANPQEGVVSKEGSFYVYTNGLFTPQIHGEIKFKVRLEVDNYQYKYTYSDFVFQHYSKDRYGQFSPVSGKVKPLEDEKYAGMQQTWEEHKKLTNEHIENHIRVLKAQMQELPPRTDTEGWEEEKEEMNN